MKKIILGMLISVMLVMSVSVIMAKKNNECARIKDGIIEYGRVGDLSTEIIPIGYDDWGYNYQAHMFNGGYCDAYRDAAWCQEWRDVGLIMKWSDTWLANTDCNGDGKLDRGYSCDSTNADSSACQGAWVTNHQFGSYESEDGKICKWNYFVKIVMVPEDADKVADLTCGEGEMWYTADDVEIGCSIWGAYAIIQQVENDPCAGIHGLQYVSPESAGLGYYK